MAKWPTERLSQRLEDLRSRLARGETLQQIAAAWGTSKQNVSQFRKRHLGRGETPVAAVGEQTAAPQADAGPAGEGYSLYSRAYQTILAQDKLIQELEAELRHLKYRLYALQQGRVAGARAKESLKRYLETRQD